MMLASELIKAIQAKIIEFGDLPVGHRNIEFSCFDRIEDVEVIVSNKGDNLNSDDDELGEKFLGIQ
jgi:hypothetical protein